MSVEVKLELGHKAVLRDEPTSEGFTHDWTVFVKGCEGSNIYYFVDKVVFHLHESFPKPKRVVKESPYQVSECGYAGFMMPIEVYFRSKEEPKKVRFEYDLYLRLEGEPVHNIRLEKLTFQNPSEDFRRKLLKARSDRSLLSGSTAGLGLPTLVVAPLQHSEDSQPPPPPPPPPVAQVTPKPAIAEKKQRNHSTSKEPSKPTPVPVLKTNQPIDDVQDSTIKSKYSPEPTSKSKEISHSNHQKQTKSLQSTPSAAIARKEPKPIVKEGHSNEKETKAKVAVKSEKEPKASAKRSHPSSDTSSQNLPPEKKKKHVSSSNSNADKSAERSKVKEEKKDKPKTKSSLSVKKDKNKGGNASQHKESKSPKINTSSLRVQQIDEIHESESNEARNASFRVAESISDPPSSAPSENAEESYNALSPPTLDVEKDFASPVSSESESPAHVVKEKHLSQSSESNHSFPSEPVAKNKSEVFKQKVTAKPKVPTRNHSSDSNGNSRQNGSYRESPPSPPEPEELPVPIEPVYHQELIELQRRIMSLSDVQQLQRIVDVIERTGKFHVTSSSFDFDLCSLDRNTVEMLRNCLTV